MVFDVQEGQGEIVIKEKQDMSNLATYRLRKPSVLDPRNVFTVGLLETHLVNFVGKHVNLIGLVKEVSNGNF